jgi:hypothetical protein
MAQAETVNITRRAALAGMSSAPTVVFPVALTAPPPHKDAAILELGRQLVAAWRVLNAVEAEWDDRRPQAEFDIPFNKVSNIVAAIEATRAVTIEGLRVKVLGIHWCRDDLDFDYMLGRGHALTTDYRLTASILRDLVG